MFSQQVHFWDLKMFTSEIWSTALHLMVLQLFLMMAELVSLHQCQVDSLLRYIPSSIYSTHSTIDICSLVSTFRLAFYFNFCSTTKKEKKNEKKKKKRHVTVRKQLWNLFSSLFNPTLILWSYKPRKMSISCCIYLQLLLWITLVL